MRKKTFNIPLKGDRNYIQGPDLFDCAIQTLVCDEEGSADGLEIAFHRMVNTQVAMVWGTDTAVKDAFAVGALLKGGERSRFWMIELPQQVSNRQPYYEDKIVAKMSFDDDLNRVYLDSDLQYSEMELWVSMIKAMHQHRFGNIIGKWVFVRAKIWLNVGSTSSNKLSVKLTATLGTKLTRSVVYRNNTEAGEVYFALI